jgi:hypothetical protein
MGTKTMTKAELTAWQELARAARRLREAQRKAEVMRQREERRQQRKEAVRA